MWDLYFIHRLLDSLLVECWLRVLDGFNPQSMTASYQRRYKNGTSSSLVWHSAFFAWCFFSERIAIEGKVIQRAECRPVADSSYLKLKK